MLRTSSDKYYNTGEILLEDNEFDFLKDFLEEKYPNIKFIKSNFKKKMLKEIIKWYNYWMGSMNKKKSSEDIEKWKVKYHWTQLLYFFKLDGISYLLTLDKGLSKFIQGEMVMRGKIFHFINMNVGNVNLVVKC